jgi:hexosaminidase
LVLFTVQLNAQNNTLVRYPVIPYPKNLIPATGNFTLTPATRISTPANGIFKNEAIQLNALISNSFGAALKTGNAKSGHNTINSG